MDRALSTGNLEALAEEDDEEEQESESEESTDSDSDGEGASRRRGEPNKFENLCDGVVNSMALVHAALQELTEFKDELLKHMLPPSVLIRLALTTGRVYRSMSDMANPVNELIRMVRLYSTPWEEKSAALKKLHEDYESKQRQLNIAIKRLQLVDAHSKRIAREKRIMNWEKLFAKLTSAKGHGRRWKFLIETIKQKAQMGLEHVQEYTNALEEVSDSESDSESVATLKKASGSEKMGSDAGMDGRASQVEVDADEGDDDNEEAEGQEADGEESDEDGQDNSSRFESSVPTVTVTIAHEDTSESDTERGSEALENASRSTSPKKVRFEEAPPPPKPPMSDTSVSTADPDYDRFLNVRVFAPHGLSHKQLKVSLTLAGLMFKSKVLDLPDSESEDLEGVEKRPTGPLRAPGKERPSQDLSSSATTDSKSMKKYEEFTFPIPADVARLLFSRGKPSIESDTSNLQIAIHQGQYEEMVAMATIDLADLSELELKTITLPPPKADEDILQRKSSVSTHEEDEFDTNSLSSSVDLFIGEGESDRQSEAKVVVEDPVPDVEPLPFPLYSLQAGRSESVHMPCGHIPLLFYWSQKLKPHTYHRATATRHVYDLVFDLTGIDLNTTSKEDLHKDMRDEALSAIMFTPEPQEETVPKADYDSMKVQHEEQMKELQQEYEKRLQELMDSLQQMQEQQVKLSQAQVQQVLRPLSADSKTSSSPILNVDRRTPVSPGPPTTPRMTDPTAVRRTPETMRHSAPPTREKAPLRVNTLPPPVRVKKNFRIGKPLPKWGEGLPVDFFERLQLFEDEKRLHKQELTEKTLREIKEGIERKLSGQHKLSKGEEAMYDALKDVSLPALFMPFRSGNVYNPRAHQYFHPTGSNDFRLTQPPSVFQLPPLRNEKLSVVNLFDLSRNFHQRGPGWLVERYIQQQAAMQTPLPSTPAPTASARHPRSQHATPHRIPDTAPPQQPLQEPSPSPGLPERELEVEG